MPPFTKSDFIQNFNALNGLRDDGIKSWQVKPGMGFAESNKWWGDLGARKTGHEGLDLRYYLGNDNAEYHLANDMIVPPLYGGKLINIIKDFLGQTIMVEHPITNLNDQTLHGFYAHLAISPASSFKNGTILSGRESLGTIAAGNNICPPHLHISTVWVSRNFPITELRWPDFTEQDGFHPCDPWLFL